MDRYMERTAHRLEVAAEERRCWAIGYNDAMSAITRSTWAWTPAERQSYHYGWMTRMGLYTPGQ